MELKGTKLGRIKELVDGAVEDYFKAHAGNKTAGKRVRAILQEIKLLAHDTKKELLEVRKKD
jgi:hypothetical protein